jgi:hypothetical protein
VTKIAEGDIARSAEISPCGLYRYSLARWWGQSRPVNFVMLNPSVADSTIDDPTIRRCMAFAEAWGYGGLLVTNLFALRSTDPGALKRARDPIGPENDRRIVEVAKASDLTVAAWGNHGKLYGRDAIVLRMLREAGIAPRCLRVSAAGQPFHPLYLPGHLRPRPMEARP